MWRDVFAKIKVWWPKHQSKEALQYLCPCVAISIIYMQQDILPCQAINELTSERLRQSVHVCWDFSTLNRSHVCTNLVLLLAWCLLSLDVYSAIAWFESCPEYRLSSGCLLAHQECGEISSMGHDRSDIHSDALFLVRQWFDAIQRR
jgi:hypothetical protein